MCVCACVCRRALAIIESQFPQARIIYGQTDSLFVLLEGASIQVSLSLCVFTCVCVCDPLCMSVCV